MYIILHTLIYRLFNLSLSLYIVNMIHPTQIISKLAIWMGTIITIKLTIGVRPIIYFNSVFTTTRFQFLLLPNRWPIRNKHTSKLAFLQLHLCNYKAPISVAQRMASLEFGNETRSTNFICYIRQFLKNYKPQVKSIPWFHVSNRNWVFLARKQLRFQNLMLMKFVSTSIKWI